MNNDAMNVDHDQPHTKGQSLQTLISGPISSSISNLSATSRCIPSERDFHFYRNFNEFKFPVNEIVKESQLMLESIGVSIAKESAFPVDIDDAYDWLVNLNDDVLERFDLSVDEFRKVRMEEEETGQPAVNSGMEDDGFELVCGKKKRGGRKFESSEEVMMDLETTVKVAMKDKKTMGPKAKVPFHVPTIRRPQDEYTIVVNNANVPFEHVWLEKSDDGQKLIHPLEKLSVLDFVDKDPENVVPVKPPQLESTPFMFVEDVKSLKELADKLRSADEFAVDLEHNQYRSFQGLTCLMQISTRTEDFVVDTLKLRVHVGPYLRDVFKDPAKRKVMHGADRDIVWLQRDFGIYICNLFDTGQASKVLKLERNSLEYLLRHFCEVTANKEYQNADWRVRPIPDVMLRYAREDTHYLMYIYDLMRIELFALSKESEGSDNPLVEVYKRSYDVCMQLYEKELLTENSYLHIYGLQGVGFNAQQLAIVSGLCEWRDIVARSMDESTGYILPNKAVLEIAKQMPVTTTKLRRLVKSKHPFVERNLDTVLNIIKHSIQNAAAFEEAALQLKEGNASTESSQHQDTNVLIKIKPPSFTSELPRASLTIPEHNRDANVDELSKAKENGASVQVLKKPTGAFGALLGKSASKRKFYPEMKEKEVVKLEQIRSSVSLPFHSFLGSNQESKPVVESPNLASETSNPQEPIPVPYPTSTLDEIIMLESDTAAEDTKQNNLENSNDQREKNYNVSTSGKEDESEPMSLSELSSNFQTCFQSNNKNNKTPLPEKAKQVGGTLQLKPFDYEEAMKHVKFGENRKQASSRKDGKMGKDESGSTSKKKRLTKGQEQKDDSTKQLQQGRRRQAFPASGNRSATFR
ncbi:hypothetical protein Lal_00040436 [Lupinus albus]|uniref:Putative ribonuclease D n=1 Tax=Lupinus albus TaxID=3870 RepID=A0A6A5N041_LUPAL|nr:putative ribonuclease D [Lupinus albus]KAF1877718.1 hypothetical protein Lal_00040436 [Lupinus albus]